MNLPGDDGGDVASTTMAIVPGEDDLPRPSGGDGGGGLAVAVPDYGEAGAAGGDTGNSSRRSRSRRPGNSRGRPLNEPLVDDEAS